MKKKNGGGIVAIVLIAIVVVFSLVTNIRALTGDESDYKTVTLDYAKEFFDMKYSVNYIPTATVHYYCGHIKGDDNNDEKRKKCSDSKRSPVSEKLIGFYADGRRYRHA